MDVISYSVPSYITTPQIISEAPLETLFSSLHLKTHIKASDNEQNDTANVHASSHLNLWEHQQTCVYTMKKKEEEYERCNSPHLPSVFRGILFQPPGNGKSRTAIALASQEPLANQTLFVVPNALLNQWISEFKKSNIPVKVWDKTSKISLIYHQCHLVAYTCSKKLCHSHQWYRVVYDETETIKSIPFQGKFEPVTRFEWLLTATLNHKDYFEEIGLSTFGSHSMTSFRTQTLQVPVTKKKGWGFELYPNNVVVCSKNYINKSQNLGLKTPQITIQKVKQSCMAHLLESTGMNSSSIRNIYSDDFVSLSAVVGKKVSTTGEYIHALVTKNGKKIYQIEKYLERCESDLMKLERSDQSKGNEQIVQGRVEQDQVEQVDQQVVQLQKERLSKDMNEKQAELSHLRNLTSNIVEKLERGDRCPICLDETPTPSSVVECCNTFFCYGCILRALSRSNNCPHCRTTITKNMITVTTSPNDLMNRLDTTIRLCQTEKRKKILVFSDRDGTYETLAQYISIQQLGKDTKKVTCPKANQPITK